MAAGNDSRNKFPPLRSMGNLDNYTWKTEDKIGSGSSCTVYKGYDIKTNEAVAVKVFNSNFDEDINNEVALLVSVRHHNILRILACGVMKTGEYKDRSVLVLELCSEGSLQKILKTPRYCLGLPDDDFILLLECFCNSLKVMRSNNILHRDIKPLNVCGNINANGKKEFKVIDFGLARVLRPHETTDSVCGTPLYWHPRMNQKALNDEIDNHSFGPRDYVDLWPVGATLYEAASGKTPFTPYNKKNAKESLRNAYKLKERGTVAMVEVEPKVWKQYRELPDDINMSRSLAIMVTPLISGLLEKEIAQSMTVKTFYKHCEKILNLYQLYIFAPIYGVIHPAYLVELSESALAKTYCDLWNISATKHASSIHIYFGASQISAGLLHQTENRLRRREKKSVFIFVNINDDTNGVKSATEVMNRYLRPLVKPCETSAKDLVCALWRGVSHLKVYREAPKSYSEAYRALNNDLITRMEAIEANIKSQVDHKNHQLILEAKEIAVGFPFFSSAVPFDQALKVLKLPQRKPLVELVHKVDKMYSQSDEEQLEEIKKMYNQFCISFEEEKSYFKRVRQLFLSWMKNYYQKYQPLVIKCEHNLATITPNTKTRSKNNSVTSDFESVYSFSHFPESPTPEMIKCLDEFEDDFGLKPILPNSGRFVIDCNKLDGEINWLERWTAMNRGETSCSRLFLPPIILPTSLGGFMIYSEMNRDDDNKLIIRSKIATNAYNSQCPEHISLHLIVVINVLERDWQGELTRVYQNIAEYPNFEWHVGVPQMPIVIIEIVPF